MTSPAMVLPGNVKTVISGGNLYDLRLIDALTRAGHQVAVCTVDGPWPAADTHSEEQLARTLQRLRSGGRPVIIDGLVAAACPRTIADAVSSGSKIHILVHLPLALEAGLDPATAAERDRLERRSLCAAASIIATSSWTADQICRRHNLPKPAVARPGVDTAALAHGSMPLRILQVGALTPGKNQLALVAALSRLSGLEWSARFVGSPTRNRTYAGRVRAAVRAAGLEPRILLPGEKTGRALEQEWDAADITVVASVVETYGMVVIESLARGVPVIVPRGTGAEEALGLDEWGQKPGFAVAPEPPEQLAEVLGAWLRDPLQRQAVRASAESRRAMLTGWDETARRVMAALQ